MKPSAFLLLVVSLTATASPTMAVSWLFDPVPLSEHHRAALVAAAYPYGNGAVVDNVEGGLLAGRLAVGTVEFVSDKVGRDYVSFLAVDCYYRDEGWTCDHPYRVLILSEECPKAEIQLSGQVPLTTARKILEYVKVRDGRHFLTLTGIELAEPGVYRVMTQFHNGSGLSTVMEKDIDGSGD